MYEICVASITIKNPTNMILCNSTKKLIVKNYMLTEIEFSGQFFKLIPAYRSMAVKANRSQYIKYFTKEDRD